RFQPRQLRPQRVVGQLRQRQPRRKTGQMHGGVASFVQNVGGQIQSGANFRGRTVTKGVHCASWHKNPTVHPPRRLASEVDNAGSPSFKVAASSENVTRFTTRATIDECRTTSPAADKKKASRDASARCS